MLDTPSKNFVFLSISEDSLAISPKASATASALSAWVFKILALLLSIAVPEERRIFSLAFSVVAIFCAYSVVQ